MAALVVALAACHGEGEGACSEEECGSLCRAQAFDSWTCRGDVCQCEGPSCEQSCDGRECGSDGCGGLCGDGCSNELEQCFEPTGRCVRGRWVTVPTGGFAMGSPPEEIGRSSGAPGLLLETQHEVTLTRSFEVLSVEVTWELYALLLPEAVEEIGPENVAATMSRSNAAAFCNALSRARGLEQCYTCGRAVGSFDYSCEAASSPLSGCEGYRLPTEAEWEYMARAGDRSATSNGDLLSEALGCDHPHAILDPIAWFCGNADEATSVGMLVPNAWGLHDTFGNVAEWVGDHVRRDLLTEPATDPEFGTGQLDRSLLSRGGSWASPAAEVRAAARVLEGESAADVEPGRVGLRPVRSLISGE